MRNFLITWVIGVVTWIFGLLIGNMDVYWIGIGFLVGSFSQNMLDVLCTKDEVRE